MHSCTCKMFSENVWSEGAVHHIVAGGSQEAEESAADEPVQ